jgi:hypothetical protein
MIGPTRILGPSFFGLEVYIGYDAYRLCLFTIARAGGASRGINGTLGRKGRVECCGYSEIFMW